jgi:hypothetical protein
MGIVAMVGVINNKSSSQYNRKGYYIPPHTCTIHHTTHNTHTHITHHTHITPHTHHTPHTHITHHTHTHHTPHTPHTSHTTHHTPHTPHTYTNNTQTQHNPSSLPLLPSPLPSLPSPLLLSHVVLLEECICTGVYLLLLIKWVCEMKFKYNNNQSLLVVIVV